MSPGVNSGWRRPQYLLPIAAAIALAIPCFSFVYLFDDFDFLGRAQTFRLSDLLPDPHSLFYRPLSREVYFGVLHLGHLDAPIALHLFNSVLLAAGVALLMILASRLLGPRAGVVAGLSFASLGSVPLLVGWASGVQDLMAIDLALVAFLLQLEGRSIFAALAIGGAILSKETAVALVPALALQNSILRRERPSLGDVLPYGVLVPAWVAIHPGLRLLFERRFLGGGAGYLGLDNPDMAGSALRSILTLANLPVAGVSVEWASTRLVALTLGSAAAAFALIALNSRDANSLPVEVDYPAGRVLILAALLVLLPVLLTVSLVRYWAPYYMCLPGIGSSLIGATLLRNQPRRHLLPIMIAFMAFGVVSRGAGLDPSVTTERNLERTSKALRQVEAGFKRLYPSLTPGSTAYVFAQTHGIEGVYAHMYRFQALRVWYQDPSLLTTKPQKWKPGPRNEYLFWIAPNLDIAEIDPMRLRVRSSGARPAYYQYQKTVRAYAFGLAASGQTLRAAQILTRMPEPNAAVWGLDARIAAMLLLADGRVEFARDLLAHVPNMNREDALSALTGVLAESPLSRNLDEVALAAFGIELTDTDALRYLMHWFAARGYDDAAVRFAQRLLRSLPGDPEADALLRQLSEKQQRDRLTPRAEVDSL